MRHVGEERVSKHRLSIRRVGVLRIRQGCNILPDQIERHGLGELIIPARDELMIVVDQGSGGWIGEVSIYI